MQKLVLNRFWLPALTLMLAHSFSAKAAPVVDVASPTQLLAPTMAEAVVAADIIVNQSGLAPGSLAFVLRSAPSTEVNAGLDGAAPGMAEGADNLEFGVLRLPGATYSCPSNTPVTLTISDWSFTLVNASPSSVGAGGGGGVVLDSRNPSYAAPASSATAVGAGNPDSIGGTSVVPQRQFVGTFDDVPFLSYMISINAVRRTLGVPVQSYYSVAMPSITLEYDNASCSALPSASPPPAATPVPTLSLASLLMLLLAIPVLARRSRFW